MRTFIEIKLLDESLRTSAVYENWTLVICADYPTTNPGGRNNECISGNADWYNDNASRTDYVANLNYGSSWVVDPEPDNPWVPLSNIPSCYVDLNDGTNHGMETLLLDENGDVIDYFSVDGYNTIGEPGCSYDFDTTYPGGNNFNLQRIPDGTGDWDSSGGGGSGDDSNDTTNDPLPDPPPGETYLWARINDISVTAGAPAGFTLTLYDDSGTLASFSEDIVITYSTLDGSATAGSDYTAASGSVTIPAGSSSAPLPDITTSSSATADEDFYAKLETVSSANAYIADHYGMAIFTAPAIDHYEVSLASSSITCLPTTVEVTACADASSPCTDPYTGIDGETATLAISAGSLADTTVTFDASGLATTTLSYPAASDGSVATLTLSAEQTPASNPRQCCPDGASCSESDTCSTTFNSAGFIISDTVDGSEAVLPTQIAGSSSATYYLRAVKTNTETAACEAALQGANTVEFAYECNNPASCYASDLMAVAGSSPSAAIARNDNGSVASYTSIDMNFDAGGNAPFTFNYGDVGQLTLHMRKTVNSAQLTGTSNAFVVQPHHFALSAIQCTTADAANCAAGALAMPTPGDNPAASDAGGATFIRAGHPFSVTVTAQDANGNTTPSYGKESTAEGVKLTSSLVGGLGLSNDPGLNNPTAFGAFTDGVATGTTFSWDEVGIITLTPSIADGSYLGTGDVSGTASGNVGRFIPTHFSVVANTPQFATACGGGGFSYIGQSFGYATAPVISIEAKNASNAITQNYTGDFWKITDAVLTASGNKTYTDAHGTLDTSGLGTPDPAIVDDGDGTGSLTFSAGSGLLFSRGAEEAPFDAEIALSMNVIDGDGVVYTANPVSFGAASAGSGIAFDNGKEQRYGRLLLNNAYGSELADLYVPMEVQYYQGAATGFVASSTDLCTAVTVSLNADAVAGDNLDPGETCIWDTGNPATDLSGADACVAAAPIGEEFREAGTLVNGEFNLYLAAPGSGNTGSVDISAVLQGGGNYLQYDWDGTGASDPASRATFGLYRGSDTLIYRRENY